MSNFFNIPAKQFSLLSSILGILLIDDLDVDQQNALGNFLVTMGQNILTAAAQTQVLSSNTNQEDNTEAQLKILKNQLCKLEEQIKSN